MSMFLDGEVTQRTSVKIYSREGKRSKHRLSVPIFGGMVVSENIER